MKVTPLTPAWCHPLSQLSRLKLLVEKPGDKLEEEEDEGRFSSSSATIMVTVSGETFGHHSATSWKTNSQYVSLTGNAGICLDLYFFILK